MVKSGDAMRGVPALFLRDGGADPPWWAIAQVGAVHAAGWMGEGPGHESGYGGGGGRGGRYSAGEGSSRWRGDGIPRWGHLQRRHRAARRAGGEPMNPLKSGILRAAGRGGGVRASGIRIAW